MRRKKTKTSRHHIIFRSRYLNGVSGRALTNNIMRLPNKVHNKVHQLDFKVDEKLVKKDAYYYLQIIRAGHQLTMEV